jgi:hypothetical protein
MAEPKSTDVLRALRAHVDVRVHAMRRLPTGLAHYVYEVMTDGDPIVVRMADPDHWNGIPGGVYWHSRLRELGVPLPAMFGFDLEAPYPYMILERLPGRDLGDVYPGLTGPEKRALAGRIAEIQDRVAALPHAGRFGWLDRYEDPSHSFPDWPAALESGLETARRFITAGGLFDPGIVDEVREAALPFGAYLADVPPAPFLDDTTTKNVIVQRGELSGIVDVDNVCFGDRLYVLALTNMALLSRDYAVDYIDAWAAAWGLGRSQRRLVDLYTAMHGVYFMGEIGQTWNKDEVQAAQPGEVKRLNRVVRDLLTSLA